MDKSEFERKLLELAFTTSITLTPPTVAFHLRIPIDEASSKLDEMVSRGVLELDSDEDGNLFYKFPNVERPKAAPQATQPVVPPQQVMSPPMAPPISSVPVGPIFGGPPQPHVEGAKSILCPNCSIVAAKKGAIATWAVVTAVVLTTFTLCPLWLLFLLVKEPNQCSKCGYTWKN